MPSPAPPAEKRRSGRRAIPDDAYQGVRTFDVAKTVLLLLMVVGILAVGVGLVIRGLG